ncbi:hypothetical protein [Spiroplasma endosymbiont of Stenodema calcarata]|uniref:hypothetical protein n=1 Tax=Spiroplasma endosymbiont of Stenodema calcarata TaxID=3139328 RepID=UPI003CCA7408
MKDKIQFKFKPLFLKLHKTNTLLFKTIFTNPRTYIFVFLFSACLSAICAWFWNTYSYYVVLPPILINFLSVSVFTSSFYLGIYLLEWRKKNFLKRIKQINLNEYNVIFVIFLLNLTLSLTSILLNMALYNLYALIPLFGFKLALLSNIRPFIWILYFVGIIMVIFFLTVLYVFLTTALSSRNLSFAILAIVTLFLIIFSDVVIHPTITNHNWVFIIIGYLCPGKYFIWFNMLITSYQFIDPLGISQIIEDYNTVSFISFTRIWQPIIGLIIFSGLFGYLAKHFFNWGMKGK